MGRICQANMRPKPHCGKLCSDERSHHEGKVSQAKHHKHSGGSRQAGALGKAQMWRAVEASNSSDGRPISLTRTWFSVSPLEARDTLVAWFYFTSRGSGATARGVSLWASFRLVWPVLIRGIRNAFLVVIPGTDCEIAMCNIKMACIQDDGWGRNIVCIQSVQR